MMISGNLLVLVLKGNIDKKLEVALFSLLQSTGRVYAKYERKQLVHLGLCHSYA